MMLMPLGVMAQTVALARTRLFTRRQARLLLVALAFIAFPDGAEIINLCAAVVMAAVLVPYGSALLRESRPVRPRSVGGPISAASAGTVSSTR
jgi:hypothetical protein